MMANEGQWKPDLLKGCVYGAQLCGKSLWKFEGHIEVGDVNAHQKKTLSGHFEYCFVILWILLKSSEEY